MAQSDTLIEKLSSVHGFISFAFVFFSPGSQMIQICKLFLFEKIGDGNIYQDLNTIF